MYIVSIRVVHMLVVSCFGTRGMVLVILDCNFFGVGSMSPCMFVQHLVQRCADCVWGMMALLQ